MTAPSTNALLTDLRREIATVNGGWTTTDELAAAARTLARLAEEVLTRLLPEGDGDLSGPYGPDGWTIHYELRASDDTVKTDHELTHPECGQRVCDAEPGDNLAVLVSLAREHECGLDLSGRPYAHDVDVLDPDVTLHDVLGGDAGGQDDASEPGQAVLTDTGTLLSHMAASAVALRRPFDTSTADAPLGLAWRAGWRWRGLVEHLADNTSDNAVAARRNHAVFLLDPPLNTAAERHTALRQAFAAGWLDRSRNEGLGTGGFPDTD